MKKGLAVISTILAGALTVFMITTLTARTIDRDHLIEDVRQLVRTIETVHPDPYINGGGKIAFHRRLHNILHAIPEDGMTASEFYRLICPMIAAIGDSHTWMDAPYDHNWRTGPWGIPVYFDIIERSLFVAAVFDSSNHRFLGARLRAIEGIPFGTIMERNRQRAPFENDYGVLRDMAATGILMQAAYLEHLVPEWTDKHKVNLTLQTIDGSIEDVTLDIPDEINFSTYISFPSKFQPPSTGASDFAYEFIDNRKETALLVIDGMMSYREAFEIWHSIGIKDVEQAARRLYQQYHEAPGPDDIKYVIDGLPSATVTFRSLVQDMKKAGTRNLLIDLRANGGGNSLLSEILVYFLYGRQAFLQPKTGFVEIRKYSKPFFEYFEGESLEKINEGRSYPLTADDYDFTEDYANRDNITIDTVAEEFMVMASKMPTFHAEYRTGEFEGHYRPENVIVLCSPFTYSSGYTLLRKLYQAGAKVLGTPSAQAGNCFGDIMNMQLDNSGIQYSLSRKYFEAFPDDSAAGRVLMPDYPLTYEIAKAYNFDPHTEILFALDLLAKEK